MKISRTHKLVLLAALLIAAGSTIFLLATKKPAPPKNGLSYNCYQTGNGWGYDVLVNDHIVIHQPVIPGAQGTNGFSTEQAAGDDAKSVIEKIKSGEFPLFQHQHLQRPGVLRTQSK
jgi:hypothetical protein